MPVSKVAALEDVAELEDHFRSSGKLGADGGVNSLALPTLVSATELYEGKIAQLRVLFDGLLWDGLTMFIARPKAGKSWLTLQLAISVAGGQPVDGIKATECGPVLYLALEEPKARTMARLRKIAPAGEWTANLHFIYDLLPLMGGGAEQLAALIAKLRPRLVVVDTLTAVIKGGGKRESDVFRSQYAEVSRLRKLAEELKTAIVVVHHERKGISDGAIESIAGTGGIAAAIDTVWALKRKPEGEATLDVLGREIEERTLALHFDQEPFGWRVLGDDALQLLNGERREVLLLLREEGGLTPAQIAAELGKSRPAVRMLLKRMREDGQVEKQGTKYVHLSHS
jgi:DNA-binding transcriptional ArsR family regulator